jgi:hypothetical protein
VVRPKTYYLSNQGYNYQQEAVAWIKRYNLKNSPVYYDDVRMKYYAGELVYNEQAKHEASIDKLLRNKALEEHKFIVLNHHDNQAFFTLKSKAEPSNYIEVQRFYDAKKRKLIIIYEKKS